MQHFWKCQQDFSTDLHHSCQHHFLRHSSQFCRWTHPLLVAIYWYSPALKADLEALSVLLFLNSILKQTRIGNKRRYQPVFLIKRKKDIGENWAERKMKDG
uniref:Uncharacterized protein n=1 Tax=Nelumbo nucifera TaxID=4432 RepID=A0A822XQM1_NELNU|nr:TPA_asm: hypothetical protein HUJ06_021241 [Nelumbo nucifera]